MKKFLPEPIWTDNMDIVQVFCTINIVKVILSFTITVIIFWHFLTFYQTFSSPQMKWGMIISNDNGT